MADRQITCSRCGKEATIVADVGELCKDCWLLTRKEKREKKVQDSLNFSFSYNIRKKVTPREAKIINEIMEEINSKKKGL